MNHVLLPNIDIGKVSLNPAYQDYLKDWRELVITNADEGDIAASLCLQAAFIEFIQEGRLIHDWIGILDEYLFEDDQPLAYSSVYSNRLHSFGAQYKQSTVLSIHTRWWIEVATKGLNSVDHSFYASLITANKLATNGLIYDHEISPTILRHRMKTELTLSMAIGVELLAEANVLDDDFRSNLAASLTDPRTCPITPYMSTEYFRLKALEMLGHINVFSDQSLTAINSCATDLKYGYCDFPMNSKFDAYMGTAKRTTRDKPIHSPMTACHVEGLASIIEDSDFKHSVENRLSEYSLHLKNNPLDIPAFQMRDVPIPFGASITPIELICSSYLISKC